MSEDLGDLDGHEWETPAPQDVERAKALEVDLDLPIGFREVVIAKLAKALQAARLHGWCEATANTNGHTHPSLGMRALPGKGLIVLTYPDPTETRFGGYQVIGAKIQTEPMKLTVSNTHRVFAALPKAFPDRERLAVAKVEFNLMDQMVESWTRILRS